MGSRYALIGHGNVPNASSPKVRHVDFYPDEWLAGTATLDAVEIGIYISVCAMIYSHGGPVNEGEVRRFVRCHGNAFNRAIRRLETLGKIERNGSEIDQKRSRNELEKARKRSGKAKENLAKANKTNVIASADRTEASESTRAFLNHQPPTTNPVEPPMRPPRGGPVKGAAANGRDTGTRLPLDWQPDAADREFAGELGLDAEQVSAEFRDFWHSLPGRKANRLDWHATFRNACRLYTSRTGGNGSGRGTHRSVAPGFTSAIRRAFADADDENLG